MDVSYVRTVDDASALIDLIVQSLLTSAVDAYDVHNTIGSIGLFC